MAVVASVVVLAIATIAAFLLIRRHRHRQERNRNAAERTGEHGAGRAEQQPEGGGYVELLAPAGKRSSVDASGFAEGTFCFCLVNKMDD